MTWHDMGKKPVKEKSGVDLFSLEICTKTSTIAWKTLGKTTEIRNSNISFVFCWNRYIFFDPRWGRQSYLAAPKTGLWLNLATQKIAVCCMKQKHVNTNLFVKGWSPLICVFSLNLSFNGKGHIKKTYKKNNLRVQDDLELKYPTCRTSW